MRAGFTGGVLIDYPNSTKAKKFFLGLYFLRYRYKGIWFIYLVLLKSCSLLYFSTYLSTHPSLKDGLTFNNNNNTYLSICASTNLSIYLVLMTGGNQPLPVALGTGEEGGAARFEHQVLFI